MTNPAGILLTPWGALYGALARLRVAAYGRGWLRAERVGAPVISVGNLTTGGTGKTPLVAWVARALADEGRRVCVLTRGYGRANPRRRVVVSDGAQMLADALTGGDEPRWLAENLPGVAVVADADRTAAARWALSELRSDCFVLDDGFQHLRLARDGDLVTIDATNPWGGGYLLPRGRLREPVTALRRAGACVVTRADLVEDPQDLAAQVAELSGGRPVFLASTKVVGARALQGGELRPGAAVLAFCALGNPSAFFRQVAATGYKLAARQAFRDHHRYTTGDLAQLVQAAQRAGAEALLTSAKDAVKLTDAPGPLPVFVLEIELAMDRETELRGWLREQIAAKK